jgi:hypothetical protein
MNCLVWRPESHDAMTNHVGDATSRWDVAIGYLSPAQWDELDGRGDRARAVFGGHTKRPGLTSEPVDWDTLGMTPRWVGEDSSSAVAALQPNMYANRGATEWSRFLAGAQARGDTALAVSMIGSMEETEPVGPFGPSGVDLSNCNVSSADASRDIKPLIGALRRALTTPSAPSMRISISSRSPRR